MFRKSGKPAKKSPLKQPPLPQAGDSTFQRLQDALLDRAFFWLACSAIFVSIAFMQWVAWLRQEPMHPGFMTAVAVVGVVLAVVKIRSALKRAKRFGLGGRGEMVVGQLLETLRAKGYRVYHDIPGNGYNIDHVIIGPGGVLVIETKTVSKRTSGDPTISYDGRRVLIDGFTPDRDPIQQVCANRDRIAEILERATGRRPKMRPVVLYPGWWVEKLPKGAEVWVLNPPAFVKFLDHEPAVLKPEEVGIFASALEAYSRSPH